MLTDSREVLSGKTDYKSRIEFLKKDEGLADSVIYVEVTIPANSEIMLQIGIKKHLMNFMDYPNDPQRGHNIMQMPVLYRYQD